MMYASANLCKQNKWHTHSIVSARFEAKNAGQISSQKTNIFMKKKQHLEGNCGNALSNDVKMLNFVKQL